MKIYSYIATACKKNGYEKNFETPCLLHCSFAYTGYRKAHKRCSGKRKEKDKRATNSRV